MNQYTVKDVERLAGEKLELRGDPEGKFFTHARPIMEAEKHSLVWVSPTRQDKTDLAQKTAAQIVICDESLSLREDWLAEKCFIVTPKPKLVYLRVVEGLFSQKMTPGVHPTAWIHPEAEVSEQAYIGPFTYIGRATVGAGSVIYGHCHLYDAVKIGRNVTIHAGTVIGSEGFGYERNEQGEMERFPHIGGVIIEDNVDIGANTCIDRGTLGSTVIREGAKIDNLVHIAHNVVVGKDAVVIADAMVGGSVEIGEQAWVAPSAVIRDRITIGNKAIVGLGAVVLHSVPANTVVVGNPAKELKK